MRDEEKEEGERGGDTSMKKRRCEREERGRRERGERERRRERRRGDDFRDTFPLVLDHVGLGEDLELVLCHGAHWVGHV